MPAFNVRSSCLHHQRFFFVESVKNFEIIQFSNHASEQPLLCSKITQFFALND